LPDDRLKRCINILNPLVIRGKCSPYLLISTMDYLDHKKQSRQRILLFTGYLLIAFAIIIAAIILLYQSYGFGVNRKGVVTQNGLVFFSSHPAPADIFINGKLKNVKTNTRLSLAAGVYNVKLSRAGYFDWTRAIEINGGDVQHYDYPFLFPKTIIPKKLPALPVSPNLLTQSPDNRWVLIQASTNQKEFLLYDIKNPDKAATTISIPANIISKATSGESWQFDEWAVDNVHVVLQHNFDGKSEFIMINREAPDQTINLNTTLSINPSKLSLNDRKYDQYYIYDSSTLNLQKVSLKNPSPVTAQTHVLNYKTYSDDTILYVTDQSNIKNKVAVKLLVGNDSYNIRNLTAGTTYVTDLTKYDGVMYVVVGSAADNRAYIYRDPVGQHSAQPNLNPSTTQVLRVDGVNFVSFSPTAQYIMAENGSNFGVYDIFNKVGYRYSAKLPIDPPQIHSVWMDGNRLTYVSNGKLTVFDFDNTNLQQLMPASSNFLPAFSPDYKFVYSLAPGAAGQIEFTQSSLRTPADR
jgi:hypothetical protein